ncbi:MAG: hypothetical protein ACOZNI_30395 [Myxococcota bacterium]
MHKDEHGNGNGNGNGNGPQYCVNIEGLEKDWTGPTITTAEIALLGGWDASQGVQEIDLQNGTSRDLAAAETVELKPGHGYCKKLKFQRG